jgi:hypothetical protein
VGLAGLEPAPSSSGEDARPPWQTPWYLPRSTRTSPPPRSSQRPRGRVVLPIFIRQGWPQAMSHLPWIGGQAPCYPAFSQLARHRECRSYGPLLASRVSAGPACCLEVASRPFSGSRAVRPRRSSLVLGLGSHQRFGLVKAGGMTPRMTEEFAQGLDTRCPFVRWPNVGSHGRRGVGPRCYARCEIARPALSARSVGWCPASTQ